jgi:hypothetical protein
MADDEKWALGVVVLLLTAVLLLTPVPLSNVAPAMVISLISLGDIEKDKPKAADWRSRIG